MWAEEIVFLLYYYAKQILSSSSHETVQIYMGGIIINKTLRSIAGWISKDQVWVHVLRLRNELRCAAWVVTSDQDSFHTLQDISYVSQEGQARRTSVS